MRTNIVHPGADDLVYEIREIVEVAKKIESHGVPIVWENIGDPVLKGEEVPEWIREYVVEAAKESSSYGYSPTKGLKSTREYITYERNIEGGIQVTIEDFLFVNGLGDAISKVYQNLNPEARIIGPNPAYPTHSSAEAAHAHSAHITYSLDPYNGWQPDLEEMERKIEANPNIVGILMVNPDNPTGFVYTPEIVKKIEALAKKYNLFMISDEIYSNLAFDPLYKKMASCITDVPAIAMRGISKEFPWPGARCGWLEFYNRDKDENFDRYCQSIIDSKMLEVCSTTLPQRVFPKVMGDDRYFPYLGERAKAYQQKADIAHDILSTVPELVVHKPSGAFYFSVVFKEGALKETQKLTIENGEVRTFVESLVAHDCTLDKRFTYYLLGATGICVVPLTSGFNSTYCGFRLTLLESDVEKFTDTVERLKAAIEDYLAS